MAITAMGLGSKSLEGDFNLDPQQQFWSFLSGMVPHGSGIYSDSTRGVIFSGFYVRQTDPAGLSVRIGRDASTERTPDSAYCGGALSNTGMATLLSTDGTPEVVDIPSAPSSGTYTYDIVSVFMPATLVATADQTAGTPELVKTFAVTGASGGIPSASEINAAAPTGAYTGYVRWARVTVKAGQTTITADDIKQLDGDDIADSWMRRSHGLLYGDSLTDSKHLIRIDKIVANGNGLIAQIKPNQLDVNAYYLISASIGFNFNNTKQDTLEVLGFANSASGEHMFGYTVSWYSYNVVISTAFIDKPSATDGIKLVGSLSLSQYQSRNTDARATWLQALKLAP